jgi:ribonuclease VapC
VKAVLDASALLALIWSEPGSEVITKVIDDAAISAVNWAETISKLKERGIDLAAARPMLGELSLTVVPFDESQAFAAGALRGATTHLGLSIGDRACLALAAALGTAAFTADRAWGKLDAGVEVVVVR